MSTEKEASDAGKALSGLGASKGGKARAKALSPAERKQIATDAVRARWMRMGKLKAPGGELQMKPGDLPHSMFHGKLQLLDSIELECHVLNDLRRVFTQREMVKAISGGRESGGLQDYLDANPLWHKEPLAVAPIQFSILGNPTVANGYEATALIEICDLYLRARDLGLLKPNQKNLAIRAEIIIRACAKVGIIALVDEATGFQKVRARHALQIKLQAFIADELQEWEVMFEEEFWLELARLEGVEYDPRSRPLRWGKYIMLFVYDAIDPDVGRELRKKNPDPHFLKNHHQWLREFGRDKVRSQITKVVTIMKLCKNMQDFREKFAKVFRRTPLQMTFDDVDWTSG